MPAAIKLTEAKCRALRRRYDRGMTLVEMVKEFGFSRIVLTRGIKRAGGKIRSKGRPYKNGDPALPLIPPPATVESREQEWRRQGSRPPKGFPLQPHETILFEARIARFCPVPIRKRLWRWFQRKVST